MHAYEGKVVSLFDRGSRLRYSPFFGDSCMVVLASAIPERPVTFFDPVHKIDSRWYLNRSVHEDLFFHHEQHKDNFTMDDIAKVDDLHLTRHSSITTILLARKRDGP